MKTCNYCGAPIDNDSQFCTNCGKKVDSQGKTCPQCGAENEDDAAFCSKCGMRLDVQATSQINTPQVVIPEDSSQEEEIVYEWEEEKGRKWWYIIGGIIIVALIAIGGYFFFMQNSNSDSTPNLERDPIALKGSIDESIGFSMKLRFKGNEIEGSEHYDKQKDIDTLSIKGTIDENGNLERKADMFFKRTIRQQQVIDHVDKSYAYSGIRPTLRVQGCRIPCAKIWISQSI